MNVLNHLRDLLPQHFLRQCLSSMAFVLIAARCMLHLANRWSRYAESRGGDPELSRKLLHVGMGLIALTYPALFDRAWPVVMLSLIFIGLLIARHAFKPLRYHVAGVIYGVARSSYGEYYFPAATAILFVVARGDATMYLLPMSFLVFADTSAAIIGTRYGRTRYSSTEQSKSIEGSAAFFATSFISAISILLIDGRMGGAGALLLALALASTATLLEGLLTRGFDNLGMPLACLALLQGLIGLPVVPLLMCAIAATSACPLLLLAMRLVSAKVESVPLAGIA